jgi:hypothetical protein
MRTLLTLLFTPVVMILAVPAAHAQYNPPYAWCAEYSGGRGGSTNCGFVTLQQCQATVSGIGGFCRENLFPPPGYTPSRSNKRQRG